MKLEIPFTEIQKIINDYYQVNVSLKSTEKNKVQVSNIDTMVLELKGIKDNKVLFMYEVSGLVDIISKVARFFLKKKLKTIPIKWNAKDKEISIDLNKIHDVGKLLKLVSITDIHIINDIIVMELSTTELFSKKRLNKECSCI